MELLNKIYNALDQVNLKDLKAFDLETKSPFYQYVIFGTGTKRQADALVGYLKDELKHAYEIKGIEGKSSGWTLVDCGEVIIHVFESDEREFYGFDDKFIGFKVLER